MALNIRDFVRKHATDLSTSFRVKQGGDTTSFKMVGAAPSGTVEGLCKLAAEQLGETKVSVKTPITDEKGSVLSGKLVAGQLAVIIRGEEEGEEESKPAKRAKGKLPEAAGADANGNGHAAS